MKDVSVIGIDLGRKNFQVCAMNKQGKTISNKKVTRDKLAQTIQQMPTCLVAMEACGGAHYWARKFADMGHQVKLISPQFVKPFVKSNKNDANDSQAIAIAATQGHMRFVPIKNINQQQTQGLHRTRELYMKHYVATANHIRSLLLEHGIVLPKGPRYITSQLKSHLEDADNELTAVIRDQLEALDEHFKDLKQKIDKYTKQLEQLATSDEACKRLLTIPGFGPLTATALVSAIGNGHDFNRGREVAAWLGLVPRQHSSGGKSTLLGMSKRGDKYLRTLLIHGARSVLSRCDNKQDKSSIKLQQKKQRLGFNKASIALANKNARVAWALINKQENYSCA
jgi:transposase